MDPLGHVAEFATANLFIAKNGVVQPPIPNGTFLDGITRHRVIHLLRHAGIQVVERVIRLQDVIEADEIFSTGNYAKVLPLTQFENRSLEPGLIYARAPALYWEYAHL